MRSARIAAQLTLAQVASGSISKQAVHQFETGLARPTLATLRTIVERLGNISLDAVLAVGGEAELAELDEQQRYQELGALARRLLRELNVTRRTRAVATFYAGKSILNAAPRQALILFRRARRMLIRVSEPLLAAEAMDWEAAALYLLQDVSALSIGLQALERYRELPDRIPAVEARMLEHLGTYRLQRGEHHDAVERYREAIAVAGARLDLARLANIYHGLAEGCRQAGHTQTALDYMERAVHIYRTDHDVRGEVTANLARAENDYGVQLMRTGHWRRAEEMIRAALGHYTEIGVASGVTHPLLSMGELHQLRNQMADAIEWTLRAIEHSEGLGETVALASGYQQLGELRAAQGDRAACEACFDRAQEILERAGLAERLAECAGRRRQALQAPAASTRPAG